MFLRFSNLTLKFFCYRSKEHDHVTESLPSQLWRIQTFGNFSLDEMKTLIPREDYLLCKEEKPKHKDTWYSLTGDIFVAFLYKVR